MSLQRARCRRMGFALLLGVALAGGCKPAAPEQPKHQSLDGEITRIDVAASRVAMRIREAGQMTDKIVEGTIKPTTEIEINGKAAKLEDLRVGDRVEAGGYAQGKGESREIIADTLRVDRPLEIAPVAATQPAATEAPASATAAEPGAAADQAGGTAKVMLFVEEVRRQRQIAIDKKNELLKAGRPPDDKEVLRWESVISRADEALATVEAISAERGVVIPPASEPPASAPAATAPTPSAVPG